MAGLSVWQQTLLVTLRFVIGWHLFYQGYGKLVTVAWTPESYLRNAFGPFAPLYHLIAETPWMLEAARIGTIAGLMVLGALLMIGLFTRVAAALAIALLLSFFFAYPPVATGFVISGTEGPEMYVNRTLIEALALAVTLAFDSGRIAGLDLLWRRHGRRARAGAIGAAESVQAA